MAIPEKARVAALTGIEKIDTETNQVDNVYTIDGRRAKNPSKGMYIINGRKVVK